MSIRYILKGKFILIGIGNDLFKQMMLIYVPIIAKGI